MSTRHRIVIADDVPEIREILRLLLEDSGRFETVGEAATGWDAIEVVERTAPALVLLDLDMPGLNGWGALVEMRRRGVTSEVVILAASLGELGPVEPAVHALAAAVLEKGTAAPDLIVRLLLVLDDAEPALPDPEPRQRDIDVALAHAVAQLERKNRELTRSNEELDHFAAVASHDLAQPLQVAHGFVELVRAERADMLDDLGREWLDNASRSLDRMRLLVRDILGYARASPGDPARAKVALGEVLELARNALAVTIEERDALVEVGELPAVLGDAGQLLLVFQNLVANAIKFVPPERRPHVIVRAVASDRDGRVVVEVTDNGPGIAPSDRSSVFEMFRRVGGSGAPGSGLGLAIVKKIVGRHGGSVIAVDPPGDEGITMRVELPAAPLMPF